MMFVAEPLRLRRLFIAFALIAPASPFAMGQADASSSAATQQAATAPPVFDVVSISHSVLSPFNLHILPPPEFQILPDGFLAYQATIGDLIQLAYIPHGQSFWYNDAISGAPSWVTQ